MRRFTNIVVLLVLISTSTHAQLFTAGSAQATRELDRGGVGIPTMTCATGQRYFQTDATAGLNVWYCTSTNVWTRGAVGCNSAAVTITATGATNWNKVTGCSHLTITLWGGGGSGGRSDDSAGGGGGGGGACIQATFEYSALSNPVVVTIGAGGAAQTAQHDGVVGDSSTFGSYLTAYGGGGAGVMTPRRLRAEAEAEEHCRLASLLALRRMAAMVEHRLVG